MDLNHARLPIPPPGAVASLATFSLSRCVSCSAAEERDYAYFLKCASHLAFFNYFLSGPVEGASCGDGHVVPWRPVGRPSAPRGHLAWFLASRRQLVELYINAMASSPERLPAIHRGRILGAWARRARRLLPRQPSPDHAADRSRAQALVRGRPGRAVFPPAQGNVCPSIKTEGEFELLRAAHARVLPLQSEGYPVCTLPRARGLFLWPG